MSGVSHILVATDGSECALHAAAFAATLARATDARVTILTVHDEDALLLNTMGPAVWPAALPDAAVDIDAIKAATEKRSLEATIAATRDALGGVAHVAVEQIWGHIAESICDFAGSNDVDLVVIGSRGRSAAARFLLGSVSTQVAHHSPCPVTIVH